MLNLRKIDLSKLPLSKRERLITFIALGISFFFLGWFFIYAPVVKKIKLKTLECVQAEEKASQAREIAASSRGGQRKLALIHENQASQALDEITRKGKETGVNFIAIIPRQVQDSAGSGLKVLPIELETKSPYKSLGIFLGEVQASESIFSTVYHFNVKPEPPNSGLVTARILLYVYLSD